MSFWKPGTDPTTYNRDIEESSTVIIDQSNTQSSITQQRRNLPIYQYRNQLLYVIEKYQVIIIVGETGCGKSTQIPQYLYEAGWASGGRCIAVTQPGALSTVGIATRVSQEVGCTLGSDVGYSVRFDNQYTNDGTRIKFLTDHMLLREIYYNPLLSQYSVVMIDEAHDRTIYTDILLAYLKQLRKKRPDLKIIISSATIKAKIFKRYFDIDDSIPAGEENKVSKEDSIIVGIQQRQYDIDIFYSEEPVPNYVEAAANLCIRILNEEYKYGDILIFLPDIYTVDECMHIIKEKYIPRSVRELKPLLIPIHSSITSEEQRALFKASPRGNRRVLVATSLAETGVTIDNATAEQRAGRSGRVTRGRCYRLYTEEAYNKMEKYDKPEIERIDLSQIIAITKNIGIPNLLLLDLITPPPESNVYIANKLLYSMNILDKEMTLTAFGKQVAGIPLEPKHAIMLLKSYNTPIYEYILTMLAMIMVTNIYKPLPKEEEKKKDYLHVWNQLVDVRGDLFTYLNIFNVYISMTMTKGVSSDQHVPIEFDGNLSTCVYIPALRKAREIRGQLKHYMKSMNLPVSSSHSSSDDIYQDITAGIASGLFANVAAIGHDGHYHTLTGNIDVDLHPSSIYMSISTLPNLIIYNECKISNNIMYIRDICEIDMQTLLSVAPLYYEDKTQVELLKTSSEPASNRSTDNKSSSISANGWTPSSEMNSQSIGQSDLLKGLFRF
ncbi:hypothetical protein WA158_002521 [Blastocystis sp. Blastoise]